MPAAPLLLCRLLDAPPRARARARVNVTAVLERICAHAEEGLHEPYKREVIGILLGRLGRDGALRLVRAEPYQTPFRWRTAIDPHPDALRRRGRALAAETGLRRLGCYHSHPEEAGSRAWSLSLEDKDQLRADRGARLELVVSVAQAGRGAAGRDGHAPVRNRDGSLTLYRRGHHFRVSAVVRPRPSPPS